MADLRRDRNQTLSLRVSMVVDLADLGTAPGTVPAIEYEAALRLSPDVATKSNWQ